MKLDKRGLNFANPFVQSENAPEIDTVLQAFQEQLFCQFQIDTKNTEKLQNNKLIDPSKTVKKFVTELY